MSACNRQDESFPFQSSVPLELLRRPPCLQIRLAAVKTTLPVLSFMSFPLISCGTVLALWSERVQSRCSEYILVKCLLGNNRSESRMPTFGPIVNKRNRER